MWGGHSVHTYTLTRNPDGTTDLDAGGHVSDPHGRGPPIALEVVEQLLAVPGPKEQAMSVALDVVGARP